MTEALQNPAVHLLAIVSLLLVIKMMLVGNYTSILRLRRKVYSTPEDYALQGLNPAVGTDPDIERARRAHQNDLENILPFFVVGLVYALGHPSLVAARIYFWGFFAARVLHTIFYVGAMQPHRTIAFGLGSLLMVAMALTALARLLSM